LRHHLRFVFTVSIALTFFCGIASAQRSFIDNFEDNNLTDGSPVTWEGDDVDSGAISASGGSMLFQPQVNECCTDAFVALPKFSDIVIELTVGILSGGDGFFGVDPREPRDDFSNGYYAGITTVSGELAIGYSISAEDNPIARRGVFLPNGPILPGTDLDMRIEAIDNTISIAVWLTGSDPQSGATLSWTDVINRFPTGDLFAPFVNPDSLSSVAIRSISVTIIPEPASAPLAAIAVIAWILNRKH